ncbi:MAG: M50 family metallopeptidase [Anaerolineales bacterium]|nr:M50 family metallopeptidase [Anaerolineales bacterium]
MSEFLLFIIVLSVLLIGHELGHFVVGKLRGVKIEEFGLGFPPRMLTLFEAGGVKYSLNWIPFGGFVRFAGEDNPDISKGLASSSKLTRTLVLCAGPAANIFLGFLAFLMAFKFAAPDINRVLIAEVLEGTPAYTAGIFSGDIVEFVDDIPVKGIGDMTEAIHAKLGETTRIVVDRDGQIVEVSLVPRVEFPDDQGPIGVTLSFPTAQMGWLEASKWGVDSVKTQITALIMLPGRLLNGQASPEEARLSGLKGIHDMLAWASTIDQASDRPFITLNLIGVISVGLALANLLPFPALDGGRLMFVLYEAVFRRRISPRFEGLAHAIGFAILIFLMVYINLQDFINPISLP